MIFLLNTNDFLSYIKKASTFVSVDLKYNKKYFGESIFDSY